MSLRKHESGVSQKEKPRKLEKNTVPKFLKCQFTFKFQPIKNPIFRNHLIQILMK